MTDIVERARTANMTQGWIPLVEELATEIEQLRAERDEMAQRSDRLPFLLDEIERLTAANRLRDEADRDRARLQDDREQGHLAEIEQLCEQVAALQASSGYEASIAQLEIERLRRQRDSMGAEVLSLGAEIERLRALVTEYKDHAGPYWEAEIERLRAAQSKCELLENGQLLICKNHDEIEQLRALHEAAAARAELAQIEIERLTTALRAIGYNYSTAAPNPHEYARRALEEK